MPDAMPAALAPILEVDGTRYAAWTALECQTSIEHMAGAFRLEVTDRWALGDLPDLMAGMACTLRLGEQTVITGYIDVVERSIDARDHRVSVSGRDATADLIDCSASGGPWTDQGLEAIAQAVCAEFKVPVTVTGDAGDLARPFPTVAVEPGESCYELLERLARQRGVLLMADGQGGLQIGQPDRATVETALVVGQNLLALTYTQDYSERFSDYLVLGQAAGSDERQGQAAAHLRATATDATLAQYRRRAKTVLAEGTATDLQARADWERTVRFGRSFSARARVAGWTQTSGGDLWRAGTQVQLTSEVFTRGAERFAYAHGLQLITGVIYRLDQGGTSAELTLTLPAAFTPEPPPPETPA